MRKEWRLYGVYTTTELNQLSNLGIGVETEPHYIDISTAGSSVQKYVFQQQITTLITETDNQEILMRLLLGDRVQLIEEISDLYYYTGDY